MFAANLALGFPLAWVETGAVAGVGRSLAEDARGVLDALEQHGTVELVDALHPNVMTSYRLTQFLDHQLPAIAGTTFTSLQNEIAGVLIGLKATDDED